MWTSITNISLSLRTRHSLRESFTNILSQKPMDSDSAFASYGSNTRYLTNHLDGPETSSKLELVKPYAVERRVRISLTASMSFTLNGIVGVVPTRWANLVISILDINMGTTGMNCLYPFPPLKDTVPKKTCFDPQYRSTLYFFMEQSAAHSYDNGSINTGSQRPISRSWRRRKMGFTWSLRRLK